MLIHHFLEKSANKHPEKVAVIHDAQRVTYGRLNTWANNLAAHLQAHGLSKNDRIALLLENGIEYIIAYYATLKIGAVAAPLNPGLKPDGLAYLLSNLEPSAIITSFKSERLLKATPFDQTHLKLLVVITPKLQWQGTPFSVSDFENAIYFKDAINKNASHAPQPFPHIEVASSDVANIIYTSGSTGQPKGVMLSHGNIVANTTAICEYLALTPNDIQMVVLPFFYVMGQSLLNTHMAVGGTLVINNRFMYPADVIKQMIEENVTGFSGVPSTYAYLLNRSPLASCRDQLTSLRYCSQAGGHMALSLKQALRQNLPPHTQIFIMYGATEASARLTYLPPDVFKSRMESIGKPIPGVTIRILDEAGSEVPDGHEGELVAAGPNIMSGYWKDPQATAAVLDHNGYHTGDIGYRDAEGWLYVCRRKDGLLKVGGHRINPTEIEDFLMATNLLIEVAVIGLPDELLGQKMVAIVVPKNDHSDMQHAMRLCREGLPAHKLPSGIIVARSLPKSASGKIDREQCAAYAQRTTAAETVLATSSP